MVDLYLVGKVINYELKSWEFAGVFSTEEIAEKNCFDEKYFLARIKVDQPIPKETHDFEYYRYPLYKGTEDEKITPNTDA